MSKTSTNEKNEPKKEEYFFSGSTEYIPVTVLATSQEEAQKEWERVRVPVQKPQAPAASTGEVDLQAKKGVE